MSRRMTAGGAPVRADVAWIRPGTGPGMKAGTGPATVGPPGWAAEGPSAAGRSFRFGSIRTAGVLTGAPIPVVYRATR